MSIISWIILGLIAGFIGSKIVNAEGQGFWLNIALGIIGALVGGFLFDLFGATGITGLNIWSIIFLCSSRFARDAQRKHCAAKSRYSLAERNVERMIFLARPFPERVMKTKIMGPMRVCRNR